MGNCMTLSDEIFLYGVGTPGIRASDVKAFIKEIKEEHEQWRRDLENNLITERFSIRVDKLAGDKLI